MFFKNLSFFKKERSETYEINKSPRSISLSDISFSSNNEELYLIHKYKKGIEIFIDWRGFTKKLNFNDHIDIIIKNVEHLDWGILSCSTIIIENTEDIEYLDKCMYLFRNYIDWYYFCMYNNIPEILLEKYINYVDHNQICKYQKLSRKFCKLHENILNYQYLLNYQESMWDTSDDNF